MNGVHTIYGWEEITGSKICDTCNETKPLTDFPLREANKKNTILI